MYIRGDYSAERYIKLSRLRNKILELNHERGEFNSEVCRRFLVGELNVRQVRSGHSRKVSLRGNKWLPKEVSVAMRVVVRETKKYLDKYRERFEQDVRAGELEKYVSGEQLEFDFQDGIPCGVDFRTYRMDREEVRAVFRRK